MPELAILGGGIAGLAAAYTAREQGVEAVVYEAAGEAGGLLAAFELDGFRFDNAVHLSFASEPEVRAVFDRTPYRTLKPESMCWDRGHWLRHPVQNNMHPLPVEEKVALIKGIIEREDRDIEHYGDWLLHQYGGPIAERWPMVYTRKYWRLEADALGVDWIGNRMRRTQIEEVLRGALSDDRSNTYYVKEMRYPEKGGYYSFIRPLVEAADIRYGHRVTGVDPAARTITFADGATDSYDKLITAMPLPVMIAAMPSAPADVAAAAASLMATKIDLVSVGFNRADVPPHLWFYIYDEDIEAARAYSPSFKSPDNVPPGKSSLQFEIYSHPTAETANRDPGYLKDNTVMALERMGLSTAADIEVLHHKRLEWGNVVFDRGMEARRDLALGWLKSLGIQSAGRFGEWDYLWSNQSFMSGRAAALALTGPAQAQVAE